MNRPGLALIQHSTRHAWNDAINAAIRVCKEFEKNSINDDHDIDYLVMKITGSIINSLEEMKKP